MFKVVLGDLLEYDSQYVCHQANCVSSGASGIAAAIFAKWPESNVYACREEGYRDEPGTIKVRGRVINMFAQYYPGGQNNYSNDNEQKRIEYFQSCLNEISKIEGLKSVAFPYLIGCSIAGGDWGKYQAMIENFAHKMTNVEVTIVRLPEGD